MATAGASSSQASLHAAVSCQKLPGTLALERGGILRWAPSSQSASSAAFTIDEKTVIGIQVSAEGQKQIAMVLQLAEGIKVGTEGKNRIMFFFNGGTVGISDDRDKAIAERNAFKNYLAGVVMQNKSKSAAASSPSTAAATPDQSSVPSPTAAAGSGGGGGDAASRSRTTTSGTGTPLRRQQSATSGPTELQVRISVLKANPSLAVLHQDVVMSRQITDQEFWAHPTRRAMLNAERASMEQKQGRNARIADPRPTTNESGEMKINITQELIRDLKAQYPVVARAFEENVPTVMDEATFWKRYFSSKLYHRLRTSARSQASQHTVQEDDVFDKYLEEEDDGLEPRRQYNAHDAFLDLGSTAEDHGETGNEKDWTMRAGVERKTLPLMRRFNDHSQSLLDSALGEQDEVMRRKRRAEALDQIDPDGDAAGADADSDDGLVIDELQEEDRAKRRKLLDMREQRNLFDERGGELAQQRRAATATVDVDMSDEEVRAKINDTITAWSVTLDGAAGGRSSKHSANAMQAMLQNVRDRREARAWRRSNDMPDAVLKPLLSQHGATTEFLRQLWAAIAPQPLQDGTMPTTAASSAPQRKDRAQRMLNSLRTSQQRFSDVVQNADANATGLGTQRVTAALAPTQSAIDKALHLPLR